MSMLHLSRGELLAVYRLRDWKHKVNMVRALLYVVLAYAMAGALWAWPMGCALVMFLLFLMYGGVWNDYWDWSLEGQRNALGTLVHDGALSRRQSLWLTVLPLPVVIVLSVLTSTMAVEPAVGSIFVVLIVLVTVYASPPVRFKVRVPWGFFAAPTVTTLMFLAAWGVVSPWRRLTVAMALSLFLFHCYAECLHVLDDAAIPGETRKLPVAAARRWAEWLPVLSVAYTGVLAWTWPMFTAGVLGGLIRWRTVRSTGADQVQLHRHRTRLWSPLLCLPEFCVYGVAGLLKLAR